MYETSIVGIVLLVANLIMTYQGLSDYNFQEKYMFKVDPILIGKDYKRLITSGFLHVNWIHFAFNMIALMAFAPFMEATFGAGGFIVIYFLSLIGGDLLALVAHKNHGDYSAVGASGAISGVIFAYIILDPFGIGLRFFFLPPGIPSWIYGLGYLAFTIWGIKSQRGNIGHEAHLGGALIGMLSAIVIYPQVVLVYPIMTACLIIPVIVFLFIVISRPEILFIPGYSKRYTPKTPRIKKAPVSEEQELNKLLDKIQKKGIHGLSAKEKARLRELSNKLN